MINISIGTTFVSNKGTAYTTTKVYKKSIKAIDSLLQNTKLFTWNGTKGSFISKDGEYSILRSFNK